MAKANRSTAATNSGNTATKNARSKKALPEGLAKKMKSAALVTKAAGKVYLAVDGLDTEQKEEVWKLANEVAAHN